MENEKVNTINGKRKLKSIKSKKSISKKKFLYIEMPELFLELKASLNVGVDLKKLTCGSGRKLTWSCYNHTTCEEHVWEQTVTNRIRSKGCPFCSTINNTPYTRQNYCKCSRPSFLNADGSQKSDIKMKKCANKTCQKEKPLTEFNLQERCGDGYSTICKSCAHENNYRQDAIRSAIMRLFFIGKVCTDCGETDDVVFECDHMDDNKSKTHDGKPVKGLGKMSCKHIVTELHKCEIVCSFCHRVRSQSRLTYDEKKLGYTFIYNRKKIRNLKVEIGNCDTCKRCVESDKTSSFDFDHIDPATKVDDVGRMVASNSWEKILEETKKCHLLCANCHRRKTAIQFGYRKISDYSKEVIDKAKELLANYVRK